MSDLERWQARYAAPEYLFGTEPNAFLKRQGRLLSPGQRVLAVADGEGRNGVWLAEQGLEVYTIDFSSNALAKARRLASARGVALAIEEADLGAWHWPAEAFDAVVAIFIQFAGPALRARLFEGIRRTLKPGGLLLLEGYRTKQIEYKTGGPPQIEHLYTRELLLKSFGDFDVLGIEEYDDTIAEGTGHRGISALIDLVARKPAGR